MLVDRERHHALALRLGDRERTARVAEPRGSRMQVKRGFQQGKNRRDAGTGGEKENRIVMFDVVVAGQQVAQRLIAANAGQELPLFHGPNVLGRDANADVCVDDTTVSRRHAEIRREGDGYHLVDAGSLNGTYLNRERVEDAVLHDGDELQIGTFKLLFIAGRR